MKHRASLLTPFAALTGAVLLGLGHAPLSAQSNDEEAAETQNEEPDPQGVFVSQIGSGNTSDVAQEGSRQSAIIAQEGDDNSVSLTQADSGLHSARIAQNGDDNLMVAEQRGAGDIALEVAQSGLGNTVNAFQRNEIKALGSAATILQQGSGNSINLIQDGSDNVANLSQTGESNAMTATQLNDGNRLSWSQNGTGLSDLQVTQNGGQAIEITQSSTGATFAPPAGGPGG